MNGGKSPDRSSALTGCGGRGAAGFGASARHQRGVQHMANGHRSANALPAFWPNGSG